MNPPDFRPRPLEDWLGDAPKELLLTILERLLKVDSPQVRRAVEDAWKQFLQSPDHRQHGEIRDAAADALRRHFHFPDAAAGRLAVELVGSPVGPADQDARQKIALPAVEWERVRAAVLSVDVIYQTPESGPRSSWRREVRVFLRDESGAVRSITQEAELRWDDLPSDVRRAYVKDAQTPQRFILYRGGAAPS